MSLSLSTVSMWSHQAPAVVMHTAADRKVLCVRNDKLPGSTLAEWKLASDDTMLHGISPLQCCNILYHRGQQQNTVSVPRLSPCRNRQTSV